MVDINVIPETGLNSKALLVIFSVGVWSGRRYDNQATTAVAESFSAGMDCGRFNKLLVKHEEILALQRAATRARTEHYRLTLPWGDTGTRLLPTKAYITYIKIINKLEKEFWDTVESFLSRYPKLIEDRQNELGELWKSEDYPDEADIRNKFHFDFNTLFLPDPNSDLRLSLNEVEVAKVRESVSQTIRDVEKKGMEDLWNRMKTVVNRIFERLSDPKKIFRNSTFDNIDELEEIIDILNVTDDKQLIDTMEQIKADLKVDPIIVRTDEKVRKEVSDKAKNILDSISSFM